MPPSSLSSRLYCAWPRPSCDRSLVTRCWRNSSESPATRNLPMWDTSNSPATWRTAKCSSRIEVYCCGISQPPKSTIRPPRATCLSYRGVRFVSLLAVDGVVEVDRVRIDERQQFLVVASSGVGDALGHVFRAVHRPLQLFRELVLCRCPVQLTMQQQLRSLVV